MAAHARHRSSASLADTLSELRIRPEEIPGDILNLFVPRAAEVDQEHDKRLHELAQHLAESFSVHAAATYALEHEPWDFAAVYYRAIDWLCHHFMEFYAPRREHISERDFAIYHDVVNGAYRLHDLMLGRLLQLAGDDCTVLLVSDHGFKSGAARPLETPNVPLGITVWHRSHGVLAMRGEKLRRDELIHGASILDITPTILSLFNLPVAFDMDGRPLAEAFLETPAPGHRDTYESKPFARARARNASDRELIKQFADLGYIDDAAANADENIRATTREENWALAQSYLDAGKLADALPLLENVFAQWPTRGDYCIELALCQMNLGLLEEAEATLDTLAPERRRAGMLVLRANIALRPPRLRHDARNIAHAGKRRRA
ncbi:MAG: alkaline phosphatase family protein [Verrucomicrobiota bacterium]|nr:alkaline phosphatase family protein [Verrucomicrobiota bacterium]